MEHLAICLFLPSEITISVMIGLWCNGSTTDFDSVCLGSNPGNPTKKKSCTKVRDFLHSSDASLLAKAMKQKGPRRAKRGRTFFLFDPPHFGCPSEAKEIQVTQQTKSSRELGRILSLRVLKGLQKELRNKRFISK